VLPRHSETKPSVFISFDKQSSIPEYFFSTADIVCWFCKRSLTRSKGAVDVLPIVAATPANKKSSRKELLLILLLLSNLFVVVLSVMLLIWLFEDVFVEFLFGFDWLEIGDDIFLRFVPFLEN